MQSLLLSDEAANSPKTNVYQRASCGRTEASPLLQVRNFKAGLDLFSRIGEVAEAEGHHPDLHLVGYNQVYAELSTHSVGEFGPSRITCERRYQPS